jgi:predicted nucleic acid-binding protein
VRRPKLGTACYAIDTQLYITYSQLSGGRGARERSELARFVDRIGEDRLRFLSVVGTEMLIGAKKEHERHTLYNQILKPFEGSEQLLVPTAADWESAATAFARLSAATYRDLDQRADIPPEKVAEMKGKTKAALNKRTLFLDVLIAVTCKRAGCTLVTSDGDHAHIEPHVGHQFCSPWPE